MPERQAAFSVAAGGRLALPKRQDRGRWRGGGPPDLGSAGASSALPLDGERLRP
jgi:hypothetical protein